MADKNEKLSKLIIDAQGSRRNTEFAQLLGINPSYYCRVKKGVSKPSVELLNKISQYSNESQLTFLSAAGYTESPESTPTPGKPNIALFNSCVFSILQNRGYKWTVESQYQSSLLTVSINGAKPFKWTFLFVSGDEADSQKQLLLNALEKLLYIDNNKGDQYTLVTDSPSEYKYILSNPPKNLSLDLSVILIRPENFEINRANVLSSYYKAKSLL